MIGFPEHWDSQMMNIGRTLAHNRSDSTGRGKFLSMPFKQDLQVSLCNQLFSIQDYLITVANN